MVDGYEADDEAVSDCSENKRKLRNTRCSKLSVRKEECRNYYVKFEVEIKKSRYDPDNKDDYYVEDIYKQVRTYRCKSKTVRVWRTGACKRERRCDDNNHYPEVLIKRGGVDVQTITTYGKAGPAPPLDQFGRVLLTNSQGEGGYDD